MEQKDKIVELGLKKIDGEINLSWKVIGEMFGIDGEKARQIVKCYRKDNGLIPSADIKPKGRAYTRILHISDNHCPFNLEKEVFKDYVGKVDYLIINGDEQDCQSISKYVKKYRIPFVDEMIATRQMIIDIIEYIKPKLVFLNHGNHNLRLIKYFSDRVHEDILNLMPETNLDFIVDLGFYKHDHQNKTKTYYEPLNKVFEGKVHVIYTGSWYCTIGDTIFAHPKAYKGGILSTVEKTYQYFSQLGINKKCIVLAHTHQQGFYRYGNTYLYESGSLCKEPSYSEGGLIRPQNKGFVYIVQDSNDNFVYDLSKLVCLD